MKTIYALALSTLVLAGCSKNGESGENRGAYSKKGGGSMEGAGGVGPGYDGTGHGSGPQGLAAENGPSDRTKAGNTQTNTAIGNPGGEKPHQTTQ
jgi:hypothetical protein